MEEVRKYILKLGDYIRIDDTHYLRIVYYITDGKNPPIKIEENGEWLILTSLTDDIVRFHGLITNVKELKMILKMTLRWE